ncbi:SpoIIE family protein phosphatase [Streptomyces sp. GSL17-111]|uniref:SpoIIE family protein phosphatase n=1 Tax=Streptomyces sp. GSL17-111 TaxID=3121596 RepID=UPI0030F3B06C
MATGHGSGRFADALVRLLACAEPDDLLAEAAAALSPRVQDAVGVLYRLDADGSLRLTASVGLPAAYLEAYRVIPVDSWLPCARAVRESRPVWTTAGEYARPDLHPEDHGRVPLPSSAEFVAVPLLVDGTCLGALSLRVPRGSALDSTVEYRLMALATACAHRWERILTGGNVPAGDQGLPPRALAAGQRRVTMLEMALSNASIGTFDWDFPSGHVVWDERSCRLFGISPEEFDGRIETFERSVHPEDRALVAEAVAKSHRTGKYDVTYRVVHPDGAVRWITAESRVVYNREGNPQRMIGIVQDRTDEHEREAARKARSDFILALTRSLAAALSTDDVVSAVAAAALRELGGTRLAVFLREEDGTLRLAGSRGYAPEQVPKLRLLGEVSTEHPLLRSVWAGTPLFIETAREYRERFPDERLASPSGDNAQAWAVLPLMSARNLVGSCVITYARPRRFSPDDRTVYTAAAGIIAQALTRASLYDSGRGYLTELQQLMLPRDLPELPGLEVAVRYRPGSEGLDVGGDWYDVLRLPGDRAALIIGDVQGHSARAAAVMGQMRTAMRARAAEYHSAQGLMAWANRTLCDLDTDLFATCIITEVDRARRRLRIVRAGHPYPMLLCPDGTVRDIEVPGGTPLGTFTEETYPSWETELEPDSTLLLYTDGLVEAPGSDYTGGVTRIADQLARDGRLPLDVLADRLVAPAASRSLHDDIAVLLLRPDG